MIYCFCLFCRYFCDWCPARFDNRSAARIHESTHKGQETKCYVCDKTYADRYSLRYHLRTHGIGRQIRYTIKPCCRFSIVCKSFFVSKYPRYSANIPGVNIATRVSPSPLDWKPMSSHIIITSGTLNAQSATKLSRPGTTWQTTSGNCPLTCTI